MSETEVEQSVKPQHEDGPFAVKHMLGSHKRALLAAAKRQKMTVGEWLGRAIDREIAAEHESRESPRESPVYDVFPLSPRVAAIDPQPPPSVEDLARIVELAVRVAALRGRPVSRRIVGRVNALLVERLPAAAARPVMHRVEHDREA